MQHALSTTDRRDLATLLRSGVLTLDDDRSVTLSPAARDTLHL